jgi:multiple sugar transport system substrate-binding protein
MNRKWRGIRRFRVWPFLMVAILLLASACAGGGEPAGAPTPGAVEPIIPTESIGEVPPAAEPTATTPAEEPTEEMLAETPAEEAAPTDEAAAGQAGTIRVAVVRGTMINTMRKLADQYTQANPNVRVTVEEEPEGGAFEALIAAGNQPDLIVASFGSQIGHLAASGSVVPLEDLPGAQELFDKLAPEAVQELYGHNYYVPVGADVTMMIYNKELFEEAGLDPENPPQTWDEFLDAAQRIDALPNRDTGEDVYGTVFWNEALAWGGWYWNMLQPMYLNANQNQCLLLNRLATDIVFDQPECALEEFFEFNRDAQQYAPPTMERNFFSRTIGMWPQYGYSWEPNLREAAGEPMVIGEDVGIAPIPVPNEGDTPYTTYGGRAFMILQTTPERQNAAWEFVQFLMEEENNLVFLQELGYLPILTSLLDDPYFQEPARQPFMEILETAVLPQQFDSAEEVANQILGVYQRVAVEGSLPPEQGVQEAAQQARSVLQ